MGNEMMLELKKWVEEQKEVSQKGFVEAENEEEKTMYSSETTTLELVIMKIDKMLNT